MRRAASARALLNPDRARKLGQTATGNDFSHGREVTIWGKFLVFNHADVTEKIAESEEKKTLHAGSREGFSETGFVRGEKGRVTPGGSCSSSRTDFICDLAGRIESNRMCETRIMTYKLTSG